MRSWSVGRGRAGAPSPRSRFCLTCAGHRRWQLAGSAGCRQGRPWRSAGPTHKGPELSLGIFCFFIFSTMMNPRQSRQISPSRRASQNRSTALHRKSDLGPIGTTRPKRSLRIRDTSIAKQMLPRHGKMSAELNGGIGGSVCYRRGN